MTLALERQVSPPPVVACDFLLNTKPQMVILSRFDTYFQGVCHFLRRRHLPLPSLQKLASALGVGFVGIFLVALALVVCACLVGQLV